MQETVTRFAITHVDKNNMRTLAFPMQGRWTYKTKTEANRALKRFKPDLELKLELKELEVRPVPCYPEHFDPQTCWFD